MVTLSSIIILLAGFGGHVYFLSPTGNDRWDGLTREHAWRSLDQVARHPLQAGDQLVLTGGAVFEGAIEVKSRGGDLRGRPIVIRSEGSPSTIVSVGTPAVTIRSGGVELKNLVLKGGASKAMKGQFGIWMAAPGIQAQSHIRVQNVDISGFGDSGISIEGAKASPLGFDDIEIDRCKVHDNFGTGIISADDTAFATGRFAHRNFHIVDCAVSGNRSGNGIILSGVDGAIVEYSSSLRNWGDTGGLGMWAWCARHVTFRYCIAGLTHSGGGDGGGFDLDGGCTDCMIEHCLSFHNDGPGYMHCDFPSAPSTRRNTMRKCVSIDDGRKSQKSEPFGFGFVTWGSGLDDCIIERNIVYSELSGSQNKDEGGLFVAYIPDSTKKPDVPHVRDCIFRDNLVEVDSPGRAFVRVDLPDTSPANVRFIGNVYRSSIRPAFFAGREKANQYDSASDWKHSTGQDASTSIRPLAMLKSRLAGYETLRPRQLPEYFKRVGL